MSLTYCERDYTAFPIPVVNPQDDFIASDSSTAKMRITVTFSQTLTAKSVTYLITQFINYFPLSLQPEGITVLRGGHTLEIGFNKASTRQREIYKTAINRALLKAANRSYSGLQGQIWTINP